MISAHYDDIKSLGVGDKLSLRFESEDEASRKRASMAASLSRTTRGDKRLKNRQWPATSDRALLGRYYTLTQVGCVVTITRQDDRDKWQ